MLAEGMFSDSPTLQRYWSEENSANVTITVQLSISANDSKQLFLTAHRVLG